MAAKKKDRTVLWITLIVALVAAAAVPLVLFQFYRMPSGSMIPTMQVGDRVTVNRLAYTFGDSPQRGDIVAVRYPKDETKTFLKRVVAVGGDRVEWKDNALVLNGKPLRRRRIEQECSYSEVDEGGGEAASRSCVLYEEQSGQRPYRIIHDKGGMPFPDRKPVTVPKGQIYVVGDNRDNSHDSRFWGTAPVSNVVGKVWE